MEDCKLNYLYPLSLHGSSLFPPTFVPMSSKTSGLMVREVTQPVTPASTAGFVTRRVLPLPFPPFMFARRVR